MKGWLRLLVDYAPLVVAVLLMGFILYSMTSCARVQYVPVETVKTDSVYIMQYERDSIYTHDSIYTVLLRDTVFVTRWHTEFRDRLVRDTVHIWRVDSIQRVVTVEREFTRMEKLRLDIGAGVLWAIPIILGLWLLYRRFIK